MLPNLRPMRYFIVFIYYFELSPYYAFGRKELRSIEEWMLCFQSSLLSMEEIEPYVRRKRAGSEKSSKLDALNEEVGCPTICRARISFMLMLSLKSLIFCEVQNTAISDATRKNVEHQKHSVYFESGWSYGDCWKMGVRMKYVWKMLNLQLTPCRLLQ